MANHSIQNIYNSLLPNLYIDLLFFIRKNEKSRFIIEKVDLLKNKDLYGKILVVDYYKGPIPLQDSKNNSVMLKAAKLDENIFKLIDAKQTLSDFEFLFVLDKYYEQAECLLYITNWLAKHLNKTLNPHTDLSNLFHLQSTFHKKHYDILVKQFYPDKSKIPTSNFNTGEELESNISKLIKSQNRDVFAFNLINLPKTQKDSKERFKTKPRLKKAPLINESEAEKQLLKSVFNIVIP